MSDKLFFYEFGNGDSYEDYNSRIVTHIRAFSEAEIIDMVDAVREDLLDREFARGVDESEDGYDVSAYVDGDSIRDEVIERHGFKSLPIRVYRDVYAGRRYSDD